jgi:hypothetical protein
MGDEFGPPVERENLPGDDRRTRKVEQIHNESKWKAHERRAPLVHCLGSFSSVLIVKENHND